MLNPSLPARPNLAQLKLQARELRRAHNEGKLAAAARIAAHHPRLKGQPLAAVLATPLPLTAAQLVIAREYGFENWTRLKHRVAMAQQIAKLAPHPRFDEAVAAMDAGDIDGLRKKLAADPALVSARTNLEPPYGYFSGATLLHHVAANPDRGRFTGELGPIPENIVAIATLLLDSGADVNAVTLGPSGGTTMDLIITSKLASDSGVSGSLMDLLLEHGAALDLKQPGALEMPLANHAPRAAEKMIELGAKADLFAAAALGRMDLLHAAFDQHGRLRSRPRRGGKAMSERDAIGLALLFAYVRGQHDAVDFLLEKEGNWNMIGVNNGTVLHRATDGDLAMVKRLVAKGADVNDRNNPFHATPLSWADHGKQTEIFEWMSKNCSVDLHDAVSFDLRDQAEARLREDPRCVNMRIDHWRMAQSTPLHWAAALDRREMAKLLLESGADVNILAGNGLTALDIAEQARSEAIARMITERGGRRSADL